MRFNLLLSSCLLLIVVTHSYSQKLYIAENSSQRIQRSDGDGTNLELISSAGQVGPIRDIVIDEQRSTAFWIEINPPNAQIKKAKIVPTTGAVQLGTVTNYVQVSSSSNNFQALAINPNTRELFVSNNGGIFKLSLDLATTTTVLPASFITGFSFISGFDLDLVNNKIYFIRPITTRELWIANLDGTGQSSIDNNSEALDVVVDPLGGKIYHSSSSFSPNTGRIVSRDLTTGANSVSIVTSLSSNIRGIAIDPKNGFIYWADGTSAVGRAQLNGTGKVDIVPGLGAPFDLAIDFSSFTPPKLYWTEPGVREIHRINTDGADFERYFFNSGSSPSGIAIDQNTRIAYWTDETQANIIKGTIQETDFTALDTLVDYPNAANGIGGIALDPSNHMMYFAYTAGNKIQRADYNSATPIPNAAIQDLATINNPFGVAIDLVRRKLYYTSNSLGSVNTGTLSRSNLDGTNPEVLITQSVTSPQRFMHDVKVDAKNGFVYWVFTEANGTATIYKADITNVPGTVTPLIANTSGEIRGIEIDLATDKLWWVSRGIVGLFAPSIKEAKLSDGSGIATLRTITFTPPRANFIALDRGCEQPIAATLSLTAPLGQATSADPIADSYFNSSDIISITITQPPGKGTSTLLSDNTITYAPNNGTVGPDQVTYQICNQCNLCDLGTINITIPNVAPVISPPATAQAVEGAIATVSLASLLSDPNNNLDLTTLRIIVPPTSGASASINTNNELVVDYTGNTFSGTDNITLEVCDLLAVCTSTVISIAVTAIPPSPNEIVVYNALSPNDDQFNPYFRIENIETVEPENTVTIYNRWGDKVFKMNNYNNDDPARRFNGKSDSGKALPNGIYFYRIEFGSGRSALEGYVTLKR